MIAPRVVVAIPLYNGTRFLGAALESVLTQDWHNIEIVVVDDASEDDPEVVLCRYPASRVRYIRNEGRLGMIGNHNRCLSFNTEKYFKILSQDDELAPNSIGRQVSLLEQHENAVFTSGSKEIIDENGRVLFSIDYGLRGMVTLGEVCKKLARKGTNVCGEPASVLVRGDALRRADPFPEDDPWLLDIRMWLNLLSVGPACMMPDVCARFRVSSDSYSASLNCKQYQVFYQLLAELRSAGLITPLEYEFGKFRCRANAIARQWVYKFSGVR